MGTVVSELILRQPVSAAPLPGYSAAGFPVFASDRPVTSEDVRAFLDEESGFV